MNADIRMILTLIHQHDGEWGWYQLDRGLSTVGIVGINVPRAITALIDDGLVVATGPVQSAATRYSLTEKGRSTIADTPRSLGPGNPADPTNPRRG